MQATLPNAALSTPVTRKYGQITVTASRTVEGGYAINTFTGPRREDTLCLTTADRDTYRLAYRDTYRLAYRVIRDGGEQGVRPDGIRQALTDALVRDLHEVQRRHDLPSRNRVEHINNLLDRLESPADTARVAELAETVRRNLADTVPAGRQPQVARSRSGVEHKPLTPPMQRAINTHLNGIVYPGSGVVRATLRALARRGLGTLHYAGTRKQVASLELNKHGVNAVKAVA